MLSSGKGRSGGSTVGEVVSGFCSVAELWGATGAWLAQPSMRTKKMPESNRRNIVGYSAGIQLKEEVYNDIDYARNPLPGSQANLLALRVFGALLSFRG